jgi:hypothetical protein
MQWVANASSYLGCCLLVERWVEAVSFPWYMRATWWVPSTTGRGGEEEINEFRRVTTKRGDHARH